MDELLKHHKTAETLILEAIPEQIFLYQADSKIAYANKIACEFIGLCSHQLVGKYPADIPLMKGHFIGSCTIENVLTTGRMYRETFSLPDGSVWSVRLYPVYDSMDQISGIVEIRSKIAPHRHCGEERESFDNNVRCLLSNLLDSQEMERRCVSRKLEVLGQVLSAIKFCIESADSYLEENKVNEAIKSLGAVVPWIQKTVEQSKELELELYPSQLDELGLIPTLRWFFRNFQKAYPTIQAQTDIDVVENRIPRELKLVIYRVLQETMNNIALEGKAEQVTVSLTKTGNGIELTIDENAVSLNAHDEASLKESLSWQTLDIVKERIELSDGSLAVEFHRPGERTIRAKWYVEEEVQL